LASTIILTSQEKDWIDAHPIITVAETLEVQPLLIQSSNGPMRGIIPDLFNLMGERLGIKFRVPDRGSVNPSPLGDG